MDGILRNAREDIIQYDLGDVTLYAYSRLKRERVLGQNYSCYFSLIPADEPDLPTCSAPLHGLDRSRHPPRFPENLFMPYSRRPRNRPPYPMLRRGERSNDWVSGRVNWTEELEQTEMVTLDLNGETRISQ